MQYRVSNLIKKQQLFPKKKALNDLKDEREDWKAFSEKERKNQAFAKKNKEHYRTG